jgi:hypothetical protein
MSTIKTLFNLFPQKDVSPTWEEFARKHNGKYQYDYRDFVKVNYKEFEINLDQHMHYINAGSGYEMYVLRIQCEFPNLSDFRFRLTPESWVEKIGKLFGLQDIQIHDFRFDKKHLIKSNDPDKITRILNSESLKIGLSQVPLIRLELTDNKCLFDEKAAEGNVLLYFASELKVKKVSELNEHFDLFLKILKEL